MKLSALDAVLALWAPRRGTSRSHARPFARLSLLLPVLLSQSFPTCLAQLDPVKNFCRRFSHQTAVIDRKLYIDGGFVNYNPLSQYPTNYTNTGLLYHDLDTPGDGKMPQLYANLTKNSSIPSVHGGTLWADTVNKRFYLFGGEYHQHPPAPQITLWAYDTIYEQWESFGSPEQDERAAVSYGAAVAVSETGMGYWYGGLKSNNTVPSWTGPPLAQPWLIKYNMDKNEWSSEQGPDSIGRAEGVMSFIPIGDGGMLVYLGGIQDPYGNGTFVPQPTQTIFLYDVLSSKWYTQNATGDIPPARRRFCGGATWAPDQSSYNIYIYGGAGMDEDHPAFDDIYVLTIPTFQWIKMYPTNSNLTGDYPHHSLSCNIVDGAQMIIIGGTFPTMDHCDAPDQWGVHNADLGQQNPKKAIWEIYNPDLTSYVVPQPIIDVIGGDGTGGATKTAPDNGFGHNDLGVLLTRKATLPVRTPTRFPTGRPDDDSSDSSSPTTLSTGAIAGIAVGGAAGLIGICIGIWLFRRHQKRRQQSFGGSPHKLFPGGGGGTSSMQDWSPNIPGASPYQTSSSPYNLSPTRFGPPPPLLSSSQPPLPPQSPVELPTTPGLGVAGYPAELACSPIIPAATPAGLGNYHFNNPAIPSSTALSHAGSGTVDTTGTGTTASTGTGQGTGVVTGYTDASSPPPSTPQNTKVGAEGRVWVQVSPGPGTATTGGTSPGGLSQAGVSPTSTRGYPYHHHHHHQLHHQPQQLGDRSGGYYRPSISGDSTATTMTRTAGYSPVTPRSVTTGGFGQQSEPQELPGESERMASGWPLDGAGSGSGGSGMRGEGEERRRETFYHP